MRNVLDTNLVLLLAYYCAWFVTEHSFRTAAPICTLTPKKVTRVTAIVPRSMLLSRIWWRCPQQCTQIFWPALVHARVHQFFFLNS